MKNLKEAIAEHLREFLAARPSVPLMTATCSPEFWDQLCSDLEQPTLPPPSVRRGHPFELDDRESVAYASLAAALLVDHLMQQFRKRYGSNRVPNPARDAYIVFATDIYPKASRHSILERIRLRKKDAFSGGLGYDDADTGGGQELTPVNEELAPANSMPDSGNHPEIEEQSARAILILLKRSS